MNKVFVTLGDLNEQYGIFRAYKELYPEHFTELFADSMEDTGLDTTLIFQHGDRRLVSRIARMLNDSDAKTAAEYSAKIIDNNMYESWKAVRGAVSAGLNFDVESPYKRTLHTETNRSGNRESDTQNKQNAFDDTVNASDTDSAHSIGTNQENFTSDVTETKSNGKTTAENSADLVRFASDIQFITKVLKDTAGLLSLDIY